MRRLVNGFALRTRLPLHNTAGNRDRTDGSSAAATDLAPRRSQGRRCSRDQAFLLKSRSAFRASRPDDTRKGWTPTEEARRRVLSACLAEPSRE